MIPYTFPSVGGACVVYFLTSRTGLAAWTDYIPVKYTDSITNSNTYNTGGSQDITVLASTTGLSAWIDYIPVFEDGTLTIPFSTDAGGYIPYSYADDTSAILLEDGSYLLLEDDNYILLE